MSLAYRLPIAVRRGLSTPVVEFVRARFWVQQVRGWSEPDTRQIRVYWHPLWSRATVEQTLLHELCHLSGLPGCASHGKLFRALLIRKAREAFGVTLPEESVSWTVAQIDYGIVWRMWLKRPDTFLPCLTPPTIEGAPQCLPS